MIISIKLTEDDTCLNSFYARLGGVSNDEMLRVESQFLKLLDFNVFISKEEFVTYQNDMNINDQ